MVIFLTWALLDCNFIVKEKNNNIYIVEQLETVHSYICIVAFHLGTIEEPREWCDDGVEPEDGECGHV